MLSAKELTLANTANCVISVILWSVRKRGLEKTLEELNSVTRDSNLYRDINEEVYQGFLQYSREVNSLLKNIKGGSDGENHTV